MSFFRYANEAAYIQEAITTVIQCRKILMWTYVRLRFRCVLRAAVRATKGTEHEALRRPRSSSRTTGTPLWIRRRRARTTTTP